MLLYRSFSHLCGIHTPDVVTCHREVVGTTPKVEHLLGAHFCRQACEVYYVQRREAPVRLGILAAREEAR